MTYSDADNIINLYKNGELAETKATGRSLRPFNAKLSIGADYEGTILFFKGKIDEVKIHNEIVDFG